MIHKSNTTAIYNNRMAITIRGEISGPPGIDTPPTSWSGTLIPLRRSTTKIK